MAAILVCRLGLLRPPPCQIRAASGEIAARWKAEPSGDDVSADDDTENRQWLYPNRFARNRSLVTRSTPKRTNRYDELSPSAASSYDPSNGPNTEGSVSSDDWAKAACD